MIAGDKNKTEFLCGEMQVLPHEWETHQFAIASEQTDAERMRFAYQNRPGLLTVLISNPAFPASYSTKMKQQAKTTTADEDERRGIRTTLKFRNEVINVEYVKGHKLGWWKGLFFGFVLGIIIGCKLQIWRVI